jgi:hypothetical protein
VRRGSSGAACSSGAAWLLVCGVALGCVVARRVRRGSVVIVRRLAIRQARVRLSARYLMEVLLLLSEEAVGIQEDRPI